MNLLKLYLFFVLFLFWFNACGQTDIIKPEYNFNFEKIENNLPSGWVKMGRTGYSVGIDSINVHKGKYSVFIECKEENSDFESLMFIIPNIYKGKKIKLTGYIKAENITDYANIWMRIDPSLGFVNSVRKDNMKSYNWEKVELSLDMSSSDIKQIVIGCLLSGKGKVWFDNIKVKIDGKDIQKLKPIPPKVFKAEKDLEFDDGSDIFKIEPNEVNIENLKVLGLIWGFLKYYHPNVANGDYNWDYELFRILPEILDIESKESRDKIIAEWVNKFGKIKVPKKNKQKTKEIKNIKIEPDLAWIESPLISKDLSEILLNIKNTERNSENYYVGLQMFVGNPNFKNEKAYIDFLYPDAGYRILSLYRYWNIIQYFFPYKYLIEEDWKEVLTEFIPKFINSENSSDYTLTVLELITRINDTHAKIYGENNILDKYFGLYTAPYNVKFIEEKAVIARNINDKNLLIGDELLKINGKTIDSIISENIKITPASNYPTKLRNISSNLLRTNDSVIQIEYIRNDSVFSGKIKTIHYERVSFDNHPDTCFKLIDDKIAYLYLGTIKSDYLPEIWKEIKNTDGLIIDLRCYPSDFVVFSLGEYLMPKPIEFVNFSSGSLINPGLFTMSIPLMVGKKNNDNYKGKVVILIDETTQSQAEYTTMALRVAPDAVVIGSTTAGADGNISSFYLPGGIYTAISGIGVYYPDGSETQRVGIIPDIEMKPTIEGIKNGRDELLEKAIEIIENSKN